MLQYNSELELKDEAKEGYFIKGYNNLLKYPSLASSLSSSSLCL